MINPNFVIIGVIVQFIGGMSYLVDTVKGKIKPNKVSWLLWSIAPLVAFAAELKQGVGIQSLATFIVGFVPLLVFIASFFNRKAEWKIRTLDIICGGLSVLGLVLWYITKVGNVAIFFSIIADGLAAIPTIVKSYYEPETENDLVYLLGIVNAGIGVLAISTWNFEHYGFPLYLLLVNTILTLLIRYKIGKRINHNK
jgi:hypothetical protein